MTHRGGAPGCVSRHESHSCPGLNWVVRMPELWLEKTPESTKCAGVAHEWSHSPASLSMCLPILVWLDLDDVVLCQWVMISCYHWFWRHSPPRCSSNVLQIIASTSDVWPRFHNSSCLSQDFIPVTSVGFVGYLYISSVQGQGCMWIGTVALAPAVMCSGRTTSQSQDNSILQHAAGFMETHVTLHGCLLCWRPLMLVLLANHQCLFLATTLWDYWMLQVSFIVKAAPVERESYI